MSSINSIHFQQSGQITRNNALRKAAGNPDLPKLTNDESSLIKEQFSSSKRMQVYSMDGKSTGQDYSRGQNIDTRI